VSDPEAYLTLLARRPLMARQRAIVLSRPAQDWHAIIQTAAEHAADLIVMTLPPGVGPSAWIFGSAADHVVRHADRPVLLLGPTALAARAAGRLTVGDVMHRHPLVLHADDSLLTAMRELARRHVPAAPVVNALGDVVGTVSDVDLLDWHVSLAGRLTRELAESPDVYVEHLARESIRKVMIQVTAGVDQDATLESALARFGDRHIGCLPVRHAGRIIGALYRVDVLHALANIRSGQAGKTRTFDGLAPAMPSDSHGAPPYPEPRPPAGAPTVRPT
jgi:CBS domain-containing protein